MKRTTLHQGRSWAVLLSKAVSRSHLSPLQWTEPASLEHCLMAASTELVSKASVSQVLIFTTSAREHVKTASGLLKSTSWAQKSQLSSI